MKRPRKQKEGQMPLFEVAILEKAEKREGKDDKPERLVFGPKAVIANDPQSAGIVAVMGEDLKDTMIDMTRAEVLVRPFA